MGIEKLACPASRFYPESRSCNRMEVERARSQTFRVSGIFHRQDAMTVTSDLAHSVRESSSCGRRRRSTMTRLTSG